MRRLMRVVQMAVVVAIAGAALYGLAFDAYGGGGSAGFNLPTRIGVGKIADTISTASIAPGEIDTTAAVQTTGCDRMLLTGFFDGDSMTYAIQYSPDAVTWSDYRTATLINGTPTAVGSWYTWAAPDTAWITDSTWSAITSERIDGTPGLKLWHQFVHAAIVGTDTTAYYGDFMYDYIRLILNNTDTIDTLRSNAWYLRCDN